MDLKIVSCKLMYFISGSKSIFKFKSFESVRAALHEACDRWEATENPLRAA